MREVMVAGVGVAKFGNYDGQKGRLYRDFRDLGREAVLGVLKDADMEFRDIQAAFCGSVYQGMASGHRVLDQVGMTGIPIVNVENACSSGSSAFRLAYQQVATELYDIVLAVGFEKTPRGFIPATSFAEWEQCMGFAVFPAMYAMEIVRYMKDYGWTEEQFAGVTVKNRRNGALNPRAIFQKEVTIEEVLGSRMIAKPLRLLMCGPNADGASAIILCSKDKLKSKSKMVTVVASVLTSALYGFAYGGGSVKIKNPNYTEFSAKQTYEMSGYGPEDMDVAQVYDAMSPAELWDVEDLGLCPKGEAGRLLEEGVFDIGGRLPVNTDGGLMSRGHPLGATGGAQIAEVVWQLRGEAGPRQVPGVKVGLCHSTGEGPNSLITILKR